MSKVSEVVVCVSPSIQKKALESLIKAYQDKYGLSIDAELKHFDDWLFEVVETSLEDCINNGDGFISYIERAVANKEVKELPIKGE